MPQAPNTRTRRGPSSHSTATRVRQLVLAGGERYWTLSDFRDLPAGAVAHALSRLAGSGELKRVHRGLYFRPKTTVLGPSTPSATAVLARTVRAPLHPAGLNAAGVLGLTPQHPARPEFATTAVAAPGALRDAVVHTRRPASRVGLDAGDGAVLELLRDRARASDLSPRETARHLTSLVSDPKRFGRLAAAAQSEPARVRAMLGALGQEAGVPREALAPLRESLSPLSKFDFGVLRCLTHASEWQAR
jgi:uncharacterized protein DUF6088